MTPDELRQWMKHQGYTYEAAAEALGVSRSALAKMLAGQSVIDLRTALACAAITHGIKPWRSEMKIAR